MSRKFLVPIDLAKNEIQNAVAQVLASAPSSPTPGQFYYDSTSGRFVYRGASGWITDTDRQFHTGTQLAATVSDFDTQVRTNRLDQMSAPTASVSLNSQKITNMADGTAATDAASWGQVQSLLNGLDWKQSARVASTANVGSLSGLLTIDGITLVVGDRVLLKDQTTASQNGIYVAASGAWSRATDADANAEVTAGLALMVTEGTVNADTQWRLTTNDAIVVNTTELTFTQIGAGTSYTQGTGISISGNVISIDTAVTARKFATTIGDGSATSIAVTHSLGTKDVMVYVREVSSDANVECDIVHTSTSVVTLSFSVAPSASSLRVVVVG